MLRVVSDPQPIQYLDGYGNPFPEEAQLRHLKYVLDGTARNIREKQEELAQRPPDPEPPVQDKPAGWWDKTPKTSRSVDADPY